MPLTDEQRQAVQTFVGDEDPALPTHDATPDVPPAPAEPARSCIVCGEPVTSPTARCCGDECRAERDRQRARASYHARKGEAKTKTAGPAAKPKPTTRPKPAAPAPEPEPQPDRPHDDVDAIVVRLGALLAVPGIIVLELELGDYHLTIRPREGA